MTSHFCLAFELLPDVTYSHCTVFSVTQSQCKVVGCLTGYISNVGGAHYISVTKGPKRNDKNYYMSDDMYPVAPSRLGDTPDENWPKPQIYAFTLTQVNDGTYGKGRLPKTSPFKKSLLGAQVSEADRTWTCMKDNLDSFKRDHILVRTSEAVRAIKNPRLWLKFSANIYGAPMYGANKNGTLDKSVVAIEENYSESQHEYLSDHSDCQTQRGISYSSVMTIRCGYSNDEVLDIFVAQFNMNEVKKREVDPR